MKIKINDGIPIFAIQEEFNNSFPYLKLEFFSHPKNSKFDFSKKMLKPNSTQLGKCRNIHNTGEIVIHPLMTVQKLEQIFLEEFSLGVQVFRKSGNVWLETTVTDSWTLEEQNNQGEALSKLVS